jgi:hypothetical protein
VEAGGVELYRDYPEYRRDAAYAGWMEKLPPYLLGVTAERALNRVGMYVINRLFAKSLPHRFNFLPGEREVLQLAMGGLTEGEAARELSVSPNTIKKRWQTLYQKVEAVDPRLLASSGKTERERLKQRRRLLLDYLRVHPEELRPH